MTYISQIKCSKPFSCMKIVEFWLTFQINLFPRVLLINIQYCCIWWLGTEPATRNWLNQWGLGYLAKIFVTRLKWANVTKVTKDLHEGDKFKYASIRHGFGKGQCIQWAQPDLLRIKCIKIHHIMACVPVNDDVITWKPFPRYWIFARGIHRSPVTFHKGQWLGALMFSLICTCVNSRDTGDLKRHRAYNDVTVIVYMGPDTLNNGRLKFSFKRNIEWIYFIKIAFSAAYGDKENLLIKYG